MLLYGPRACLSREEAEAIIAQDIEFIEKSKKTANFATSKKNNKNNQ